MKPIYIVGAGPGALDLMTIRASERLKQAEVLVWADSLIPPAITEIAPKSCERIPTSSLTLEEIIDLLIDRHKKGKRIVRLHDGDPCLYGALAEQICRLAEADIEVEVVPGLSAYQATAATLKTELTIPNQVQTIVLSRASGRTGIPERERLEHLASIGASLCLYLSARHIKEVEATLLKHYPANTPVAIGYRVSWDDEWLKIVPLKEMATTSIKRGLIRTTLYVISPALNKTQERSKLYKPTHSHLFRRPSQEV